MTEPKERIERDYDLEQRLIGFASDIMDFTEDLPTSQPSNHLSGQLLRSGTAPAPNYGEAQAAESRKDFIHKMRVCLKELRETNIWLKICRKRQSTLDETNLEELLTECQELISIFASSIKTAENNADE